MLVPDPIDYYPTNFGYCQTCDSRLKEWHTDGYCSAKCRREREDEDVR